MQFCANKHKTKIRANKQEQTIKIKKNHNRNEHNLLHQLDFVHLQNFVNYCVFIIEKLYFEIKIVLKKSSDYLEINF